MPASKVHEAEIRERILLGAQTSLFIAKVLMTWYTHLQIHIVHYGARSESTSHRDENGQMHLQMKLILQSNEII